MTTRTLEAVAKKHRGRHPTWDMAILFPDQGTWTEEEYLDLPGGMLVEYTNGHVEVLPMPSEYHQDVAGNIYAALRELVRSKNLGKVLCAPMPVKVDQKKYREPDVVFKRKQKLSGNPKETKFWDGADLVVEVVSEGAENRRRHVVVKRGLYCVGQDRRVLDRRFEQVRDYRAEAPSRQIRRAWSISRQRSGPFRVVPRIDFIDERSFLARCPSLLLSFQRIER